MTARDKLAATLLNHWYCVERAVSINRLKKVPSLKEKYKALEETGLNDEAAMLKLCDGFCEYNNKCFHSNIVHLIENDETVKALNVNCSVSKSRAVIKITAAVPNDQGLEVEALIKAMKSPEQDQALENILEKSPRFDRGQVSKFVLCVPCGGKGFFHNFKEIETDFVDSWNAIKTILSARQHVLGLLKDEDKKEILAGRAYLNFTNPRIEDNVFKAEKFQVVETPEAKAAREIRERLMAALKRRTKKVKDVEVRDEAVEYIFEEEGLEPFRVKLDVITHW